MYKTLLLALAVSLSGAPLAAHAAPHGNSMQSEMDRYMQAALKVDHFMGAVLVARDGHVVIAKGYGKANVEGDVPNTPDTEFRIGSVTKQFTAMAVMMLQAEGKLNVKDSVCKYVPDCPETWQPITISEVLSHTSGIPNFTGFLSYPAVRKKPHTPAELVALFKDKPLDFKPGEKFEYSNSGYVLLGYIIEHVAGESYAKFLQQHIFDPLKMSHSGYDKSHPTARDHAKGYNYTQGAYKPASYVDMSVPFSAGALYSTVRDLYTWDRALAAGKLLPHALHQQMFSPQAKVGSDLSDAMGASGPVHYGYCWFISREFGHKMYSHEGGIAGFTSLNSWFPKQDVYVIVLDNMSSANIFTIGNSLAAIAFGEAYTLPKAPRTVSLPAKVLEGYVGTYKLAPDFAITVRLKDGGLTAQGTGQPAFSILPESKTEFFAPDVKGARIDFQTDKSGRVTGLVLHQHGRDMPGRKLAPGEKVKAPSEATTVSVSADILQRYVGKYQLAPSFYITITREGDQLKAQGTGQGAFPIFPKSKTVFYYKVVDAQIHFTLNDDGEVKGLVLHQNGKKMPGKKVK
jgi:CubicO group peptidase (beta-lactamase class C family)